MPLEHSLAVDKISGNTCEMISSSNSSIGSQNFELDMKGQVLHCMHGQLVKVVNRNNLVTANKKIWPCNVDNFSTT